ncbi:MAG: HD domain-containing protein [Deltaproteobacteria bacterium]|nr:HD domain-containing protein [Deltaproteobacteria bacterium]
MVAIFDPVHGTIEVNTAEIRIIDSRPFQRLRYIKQLGFAELAFPGASHSRYSHSLGAMHMATRMIDRALCAIDISQQDKNRLRQTVRLAMLLHDLGHPPLSHVSERVMPKVAELNLGSWIDNIERQATHEDYTLKLILHSELYDLIKTQAKDTGVEPEHIAALICGHAPANDKQAFVINSYDLLPLLTQIVSSEMDADRMDYLRRDAYACGVSYGNFDHQWLVSNVTAALYEGQYTLGLQHKGVWAFENFLLARLHMFLAIYYHHTTTCFEHMLGKFYETSDYQLPAHCEEYLNHDDIQLWMTLRSSNNPWAERIVQRRPYRLLVETHDFNEEQKYMVLDERLHHANIDFFRLRSQGVLSKYFRQCEQTFPLLVIEPEVGRISRIEEYTPLYRRFSDVVAVSRIFCLPEHIKQARAILGDPLLG